MLATPGSERRQIALRLRVGFIIDIVIVMQRRLRQEDVLLGKSIPTA
jgi:hypothetical protein